MNDREDNQQDNNNTLLGHILSSTQPGESEAEGIAHRIEKRRQQRVPVTLQARIRFLHECSRISRIQGYDKAEITFDDLQAFRDEVDEQVQAMHPLFRGIMDAVGVHLHQVCLLNLLNRAIASMETHLFQQDWFHYKEFSYFHTVVQSPWPWWRTQLRQALLITLCYYLLTPLLFCNLLKNHNICQRKEGTWYSGWLSSLYFASTTVSTVGYGDLTVDQQPILESFLGAIYMIGSVIVSIIAVSAAADAVFVPFEGWIHQALVYFMGKEDPSEFLYKKVSRLRLLKVIEITIQFLGLNLLGVLADRLDVWINGTNVSWMTSFYWAIQVSVLCEPTSQQLYTVWQVSHAISFYD